MRRYLQIVRFPHLGRIYAASLLARLPMGINGLAIVLLLRAETGSFGVAGAIAGALALGSGLGAPLGGRLIDAFGARLLLPLAGANGAGLVGLVALARADAPTVALIATALATGVVFPPTSSVLRAQYPRLLAGQPDLMQGAFALDSVLTETIFTAGPPLTAGLVVLFEPAAVLLVSAAAVVAVWSLGSMTGGLIYGARPRRGTLALGAATAGALADATSWQAAVLAAAAAAVAGAAVSTTRRTTLARAV